MILSEILLIQTFEIASTKVGFVKCALFAKTFSSRSKKQNKCSTCLPMLKPDENLNESTNNLINISLVSQVSSNIYSVC